MLGRQSAYFWGFMLFILRNRAHPHLRHLLWIFAIPLMSRTVSEPCSVKVEGVLIHRLFLLPPLRNALLHNLQLLGHSRITRHALVRGLQILDRRLVVSLAGLRQ